MRNPTMVLGLVITPLARNTRDQRLATIRDPHRSILSRVHCIALFNILRLRRLQRQ